MEKDLRAIIKDGFDKIDIKDIKRNLQLMVDTDGSKNIYYRMAMWTFYYCINMGIIFYPNIREYVDRMDIGVIEAILDSFKELSNELNIN